MWDIRVFDSSFWVWKIWTCLCQTADAMLKMDPRYDHYTAVSFPGGGNLPNNSPPLRNVTPYRTFSTAPVPIFNKEKYLLRVFWIATRLSLINWNEALIVNKIFTELSAFIKVRLQLRYSILMSRHLFVHNINVLPFSFCLHPYY